MSSDANVNHLDVPSPVSYTRPSHRRGLSLVLATILLLLLFSHPLIHGDGLAYFMYLDTIAGDGDLDLSNQALRFGHVNQYQLFTHPATGELVTAFPFGSAYLLAPFYWLGRAIEPSIPAVQAHREYFRARQGVSLAFSLTGSFGALCYAVAAVWLAYLSARRLTSDSAAAMAALACLIGTPLLFYATIEPLDSHVYGAMLIACALWLATRSIPPNMAVLPLAFTPIRAFALGLVLGMATLVRWQLVLYAAPVGVALLGWSVTRPSGRQIVNAAIAFTIGVGVFVGLCASYFWRYFGSAFFIPTEAQSGQHFIGPFLHFLPQVLFDGERGWLTWSPIAALGLVGLLALLRTSQPAWRLVGVACLAGIGLELALNASLYDWSGGWAFGQRRMTEAYAPLVLGTAWLMHTRRWPHSIICATALLATLFSTTLFAGHLYYTHTNTEHPEGGNIVAVVSWLVTQPHGPPLWDVFRDRYGPWAWAKPEL